MSKTDWDICRNHLIAVSRTFSQPISMLPTQLERAVTCGYLLCRIVDTIEDNHRLTMTQQDALYESFIGVLEGRCTPDQFVQEFSGVEDTSDDASLCRDLPVVMRIYSELPAPMQATCTQWITEMARGMAIYSHRAVGDDGITALTTLDDLVRYCYFVAGTVGQMLTELFLEEIGDLSVSRQRTLRAHAEAFGLGLQLVNILKDITDDAERKVSFIPRQVVAEQELTITQFYDSEHRSKAHKALTPVFETAKENLNNALLYCLALPPSEREIRLFCLLPLWMAARTVVHARGNDSQFVTGEAVKISRSEVTELIQDCISRCGDDEALQTGYSKLWN